MIQMSCFQNELTSLDISNNIDLEHLQASNNQLTTLDISNNVALSYMECFGNPLTCVKVNEEQLENYDWTYCSRSLFSLDCN